MSQYFCLYSVYILYPGKAGNNSDGVIVCVPQVSAVTAASRSRCKSELFLLLLKSYQTQISNYIEIDVLNGHSM